MRGIHSQQNVKQNEQGNLFVLDDVDNRTSPSRVETIKENSCSPSLPAAPPTFSSPPNSPTPSLPNSSDLPSPPPTFTSSPPFRSTRKRTSNKQEKNLPSKFLKSNRGVRNQNIPRGCIEIPTEFSHLFPPRLIQKVKVLVLVCMEQSAKQFVVIKQNSKSLGKLPIFFLINALVYYHLFNRKSLKLVLLFNSPLVLGKKQLKFCFSQ